MELSTDKPESSDRKELSASSGPRPATSFAQSPAAMKTTSLEQVQATPGLSFSSNISSCFVDSVMQQQKCVCFV